MADDSIEIVEEMEFHPCDTPRGTLYYNLNILTDYQQTALNGLKYKKIRSNEKYMQQNQEIRAFCALILRHVLKGKPRRDLIQCIAKYFSEENRANIQAEVQKYIEKRGVYPIVEEVESTWEEDMESLSQEYLERIRVEISQKKDLEEEEGDTKTPRDVLFEEYDTETFIRRLIMERLAQIPYDSPVSDIELDQANTCLSVELSITDYDDYATLSGNEKTSNAFIVGGDDEIIETADEVLSEIVSNAQIESTQQN